MPHDTREAAQCVESAFNIAENLESIKSLPQAKLKDTGSRLNITRNHLFFLVDGIRGEVGKMEQGCLPGIGHLGLLDKALDAILKADSVDIARETAAFRATMLQSAITLAQP